MTSTCNCLSWIENRVEKHLGVDAFLTGTNKKLVPSQMSSTIFTFNFLVMVGVTIIFDRPIMRQKSGTFQLLSLQIIDDFGWAVELIFDSIIALHVHQWDPEIKNINNTNVYMTQNITSIIDEESVLRFRGIVIHILSDQAWTRVRYMLT